MSVRGLLPALWLCVAWPSVAADAGPAGDDGEELSIPFTVRIEPNPAPFATPFDLVIELTRRQGQRLRLPGVIPGTDELKNIGPARRSVTPPPKPGDPMVETLRVPFIALGLEDLKTPALVLTDPEGRVLEIPAVDVPVQAPDEEAQKKAAAEGQEPTPPAFAKGRTHHLYTVDDPRPRMVLFSALISGIVALLSYLALRRRSYDVWFASGAAAAPVVEERPPAHELALARLEALLAEGLLQRGEVSVFVPRLMDEVLRSYLEDRFEVRAEAETTRELCENLLSVSAPGLDVTLIEGILSTADLIKFARAEASVAAAHQMAGQVRALIEATKQEAQE